jgi:uncharacterized protein (DUF885 family)
MTTQKPLSPIFAFSEEIVERLAKSDPIFATDAGVKGHDHLLPDFSTEEQRRNRDQMIDDLEVLNTLPVLDDVDRIAQEVIRERMSAQLTLLHHDEPRRTFSVLRSPVSSIRQVFEMMESATPDDADIVRQRLARVRPSLDSWRSALRDAAVAEQLPALRHVIGVADQAQTHAQGGYVDVARRVAEAASVDFEASGLREAAEDAEGACGDLATWLRSELAPKAVAKEACGAERYGRWATYYTGATLDLGELYAWGYQDLRRINSRMWELAQQLLPGATSLVAVADHLDLDPSQLIVGTDALLAKLKGFTATTVEQLDGVHFDIDERIRFCDARLAPEGGAAAPYYIQPSEDLSRPGTTWFPTLGKTTFPWWREASTWYHESVPGHHLQCAIAILAIERQSRFHRLAGWTSGYGEGWALYAERLMDELGYFADPAEELGFLSCQALRAGRIVVDLGLHLELDAPHDLGVLGGLGDCSGKRWTPEMAVALLEEWAIQSHEMSTSEVDRYLGVPGQAISYKVGERAWLKAREDARTRLGDSFDLKAFHAHALTLGPLGLDTFAAEMSAWPTTSA